MKKRIIALLLVCLMVVSAVPAWVGAEETAVADAAGTSEAATCPGKDKTHTLGNCSTWTVLRQEKEPTCAEWGSAVFECTTCGTQFVDKLGEPTGNHTELVTIAEVVPTCTTPGNTAEIVCSVCGKKIQEKKNLPATGHNWVVQSVTGDCTTGGTVTEVCANCGGTQTRKFDVNETTPGIHEWGEVKITQAPTCTVEGKATLTCSKCGKSFENVSIKMVEHTWVNHPAKAKAGVDCKHTWNNEYNECSVCGTLADASMNTTHTVNNQAVKYQKSDFVFAGDHNPATGTCTSAVKCTVCDAMVPATGHSIKKDPKTGLIIPSTAAASPTHVPATCTEGGYYIYKCQRCDYTEKEYIANEPALKHETYEEAAKREAGIPTSQKTHGCVTKNGVTTRYWVCNKCNERQEAQHTAHEVKTTVHVGTCAEAHNPEIGMSYTYCAWGEDCPDYASKNTFMYTYMDGDTQKTIALVDAEGNPIKEAVVLLSCTLSYGPHVAKTSDPVDCTHAGTCKYCGGEMPALGHKYKITAGETPTCTKDGKADTWECQVCGYRPHEHDGHTIKAFGHKAGTNKVPKVNPTCTTDGHEDYWLCVYCNTIVKSDGSVYEKKNTLEGGYVIPKLGHDYTTTTKTATENCVDPGYTLKYCKRCGEVHLEGYATAKGHQIVQLADNSELAKKNKPATCTTDGYFVGKCQRCNTIVEYVLSATGHKNKDGNPIVDDCMDQVADRYCVNAGCEFNATAKKEVPKTHHAVRVTDVKVSCFTDGYHLEYCENCQTVVKLSNQVKAPGHHTWKDWEVETAPTCEKAGTKVRYCSVCGEKDTETQTVEATGHKWDDNGWTDVEGQEATHTHGGKQERSCLNGCGEKQTRDTAPIPGFDYVLSADNAVVSGAGYANSSLVAVTVSLESAGIDVHALGFRLNYDKDVVKFEKAEFAEDTVFVSRQGAKDNGGYVVVTGFTANSGKETTDETITDETVVTLYFRIISADATGTTFSISDSDASDKNGDVVDASVDSIDIEIQKFLDGDNDGEFSLRDITYAEKIVLGELINGELVEYDVTVDIDKDGEITVADIQAMVDYYLGELTYEDIVAMGVAAE